MLNKRYKTIIRPALILMAMIFIVLQFIPSSFNRTNPPVTGEPEWDSPQTKMMFRTACADCHSNESRFPWYSNIAPVSWLIENDIREGRKHFNVSEWDRSQRGGEDAAAEVRRGAMPVGPYLMMHPEANFTAAEKVQLVNGLIKTFGGEAEKNAGYEIESEEDE